MSISIFCFSSEVYISRYLPSPSALNFSHPPSPFSPPTSPHLHSYSFPPTPLVTHPSLPPFPSHLVSISSFGFTLPLSPPSLSLPPPYLPLFPPSLLPPSPSPQLSGTIEIYLSFLDVRNLSFVHRCSYIVEGCGFCCIGRRRIHTHPATPPAKCP